MDGWSKECNGKSRVEYEMSTKQWVINEIFVKKKQKGHQLFQSWQVQFFSELDV